jgi:hypothetical protein
MPKHCWRTAPESFGWSRRTCRTCGGCRACRHRLRHAEHLAFSPAYRLAAACRNPRQDRGELFTNDVGVDSTVHGVLGARDAQTLKAVALELGVDKGFAISHGDGNFEDV